jgi:hypothetical protein
MAAISYRLDQVGEANLDRGALARQQEKVNRGEAAKQRRTVTSSSLVQRVFLP